jgi:hypothetical protein
MNPSYPAILENANSIIERPARMRAVIEFEGDVNRLLAVYPQAGSHELDEALQAGIRRRWSPRGTPDREQITAQIDELFELTLLAYEVRDPQLLETVLRELTLLNDILRDLETNQA